MRIFEPLKQSLSQKSSDPLSQERALREEIERWESRAFSLNSTIGLLRAALTTNQQQHEALESYLREHPEDLEHPLQEMTRRDQHVAGYALRQLLEKLMEVKKQLLEQGEESLRPRFAQLTGERRERMEQLWLQSLEGVRHVAVARQEAASLRELETQRQLAFPPLSSQASSLSETPQQKGSQP